MAPSAAPHGATTPIKPNIPPPNPRWLAPRNMAHPDFRVTFHGCVGGTRQADHGWLKVVRGFPFLLTQDGFLFDIARSGNAAQIKDDFEQLIVIIGPVYSLHNRLRQDA